MTEISVIITCYNRQDFILDTLISFQNQTFSDFQAIIVDGGSTDGTHEILNNFCSEDKRFSWFQKNKNFSIGPSSSRNLALNFAKGKFICFSDDDDLQHKESFEIRHKFLKSNSDLLFVCCNTYNFSDIKNLPNHLYFNNENFGNLDFSYIDDYISGKIRINTAAPLIKKEFFHRNKFQEDLFYGDDWEFNLRLLASGNGLLLKECLIYRRMHPHSMSVDKSKKIERNNSNLRAYLYGFDFLKSKNLLSQSSFKTILWVYIVKGNLKYLKVFCGKVKKDYSSIRLLFLWFLFKFTKINRIKELI